MDDLSLSDITPECLEACGWRRNEGLMDEDDGLAKVGHQARGKQDS